MEATEHPAARFGVRPGILPIPGPQEAGKIVARIGREKFLQMMEDREKFIRLEREDPLRYGYEPPIWKLCDMLLDLPWTDKAMARRVRERLGFEKPVDIVLANGGNRAAKSRYGARTVSKMLWWIKGAKAYCFHQSENDSKEQQQPVLKEFLPPDLQPRARKGIKSATTYIAYSIQNGFSEGRFVLPNLSMCGFRNYGQEVTMHEGLEPNIVWCDELAGADLLDTLRGRLATRNGKMIITFTPITGYTPTIRLFYASARATLKSPAYLLPADGGEPDLEGAMYTEDVIASALGEPARDGRPTPSGRKFERVPRVMKCHDDKAAVVFFHASDNPYGNPRNVWDLWKGAAKAVVKMRLYGVAEKAATNKFPKFSADVHVVPDAKIPTAGTRFMFLDPAGGRNFFIHWWIDTTEGAYLYREWPGNYEIEGEGFPGPWAENDGKLLDGRRGPAQKSFGWGVERYKREIARLERWKDWLELKDAPARPAKNGKDEQNKPPQDWMEHAGDGERMLERYMDSRGGGASYVKRTGVVTLFDEFNDLHMYFLPTEGKDEETGIIAINSALDYDTSKPVDFFNKPRMFVAASCVNTIYALENWTGDDGQKGACRDPIDLLRYRWTSPCGYVGTSTFGATSRGGHY